ncbi:FAD:protein FMN transferase [Neisseria leonii]|uniref:FAD:protein FMN transferase n=1 Tax=Neisseria leonii TaxID=2995413 RepID=UPI00237BC9BE|nr:FAD:protein FMN transferase [Neisseria sp. 3986]MDD9326058.1 FAD:protein FMN transferase [Neisseria sp. 3986]
MKRLFCRLLLWGGLWLLAACMREPSAVAVIQGQTMGTTYTVKYIEPQGLARERVQQELEALLESVNREMSTYREDSEISAFNRMGAGEAAVSAGFAEVVDEAVRLNGITRGALDVTVGPLVNLWGFGPDKKITREPTARQLAAAAEVAGIDKISLRRSGGKAFLGKKADGVYLDLSAVAKGYGVDVLAHRLEALGVSRYLVEVGGELRGRGTNPQGQPWQVGIEQPSLAQGQAGSLVVPLDNMALATSGDYRNFRLDGAGQRLSHIIHPKTQRPISHSLASVSVLAPQAVTADGLATGLFVLGEDEAMAVAEAQNLPVFLIIYRDGGFETRMSPALRRLLDEK